MSKTIDKKHSEMIEEFKNNEEILIPMYQKEIFKLKKLKNTEEIQLKIQNLNNFIYKLEKYKKDYLLNCSKYIFNYYEDKSNINSSKTNLNNNQMNKFFNIDNTNEIIVPDETTKVIEKYYKNINTNFINLDNYIYQSDKCPNCLSGEIQYIDTEGISICNICSNAVKKSIIVNEKLHGVSPTEAIQNIYSRINHFKQIIAQIQAKEYIYIPDYVYENIKSQINKQRLNLNELNNHQFKNILKKLKYNKYYEHIPFIKSKFGINPIVMSIELEEKLCNLFQEIQKPFAKYCPINRVNFFNYFYTLYKLCELLNEKQYLPLFPLLKDRKKLIEHDAIWKLICNYLDWEYFNTVI